VYQYIRGCAHLGHVSSIRARWDLRASGSPSGWTGSASSFVFDLVTMTCSSISATGTVRPHILQITSSLFTPEASRGNKQPQVLQNCALRPASKHSTQVFGGSFLNEISLIFFLEEFVAANLRDDDEDEEEGVEGVAVVVVVVVFFEVGFFIGVVEGFEGFVD
jgi:hypothetical protein